MRKKCCCVVNCKNKNKNNHKVYFKFPKPELNIELRKKWIAAINRKNADGSPWYPKPNDLICSLHFLNQNPEGIDFVPSIFPVSHPRTNDSETVICDDNNQQEVLVIRVISNNQSIIEASEDKTNRNTSILHDCNTIMTESRKDMEFGRKNQDIKSTRDNFSGSFSNLSPVAAIGPSVEKHNSAGSPAMNKVSILEECRACLQKIDKQTAYNLFEAWYTPWAVRGAIIADDLSKFADVEITESDNYSKTICQKCYHHLSDACTFMITVQMSDSILRQRVADNHKANTPSEVGTSWPQPILLRKSGTGEVNNRIEVEVKQEVLSEDENGENVEQDWEPTMDIKIEPEEISAPVKSNVDVNCALDKAKHESTYLNGPHSILEQDNYWDTTVKQEHMSGDELLVAVSDLPLDCMLCFKVFSSVSGLKAHVISQHSYGAVKRRAEISASSVKSKVQVKGHNCNSCNQSFTTSTDLMVHQTSHSEHVCYVCDRKFNSFQQLTQHGPRCQKKHANPAGREHKRPQRSKKLSHPIKNTKKAETKQEEPPNSQEIKIKAESPQIEDVENETVQELVKSWPFAEINMVEATQKQSENIIESKLQIGQNLEKVEVKSAKKDLENRIAAERKQEEPVKIEIEIESLVQKTQEPLQEPKSLSMKVEIEDAEMAESVQKQTEYRLPESEKPGNKLSEPKIPENKLSESKIELKVDHVPEESYNVSKNMEDAKETVEGKVPKSETELNTLKVKNSKTDFQKPDGSLHITSISSESKTCNPLQNINQYEPSHSKVIDDSSSLFESAVSLPYQENLEKILTNISCERLLESSTESHNNNAVAKKIDSSIEQNTDLENSTSKNQDNSDIPKVSPTRIVEISEMKVHLAINPLDKGTELLETEMDIDDIECKNTESCEPKLASVISEQSDIHNIT